METFRRLLMLNYYATTAMSNLCVCAEGLLFIQPISHLVLIPTAALFVDYLAQFPALWQNTAGNK